MLGDVPNAPAPATAPEQDYPIELLCPICFNLLDDPVTWPAPQCEEKHNFCRHCIETMCETREVKSLCPICRAPSTVPVLDQLWTLPVDEILNERLKTEYPEHHAESMARRERKHAEYDALPRICVPVFESCEHQLAEPSRERLHRGKKVDFRISKPEHLLLLATCFANPETTRFGILLEGERWGYIAGIVSPQLFSPGKRPKTANQALAKLITQNHALKKVLKVQILLVDTFRLDGPLASEVVDPALAAMIGKPTDPNSDNYPKPLRIGRLLTSPDGEVPGYVK